MIASFRHKFIYVKGRKVASTSIELALSPLCAAADIVTPISPADEFNRLAAGDRPRNFGGDPDAEAAYIELVAARNFRDAVRTGVHSPEQSLFYNHMPLREIERKLDVPFREYTLVVSERNPYSKILSLANMRLSFSSYSGDAMENSKRDIVMSLRELFVSGKFRMVRNLGLYRTRTRYRARVLIKQENFDADLRVACRKLGLEAGTVDWPHAKKGVISERLDPTEMFTREQLDLVNAEFAEEFEKFGYSML